MLTLESFATKLLQTEDLDPVYVAIHRVQPSWGMLSRLLLAYWCFYHLGAASYIAENGTSPKKFWALMHDAAANDYPTPADVPLARWPRASERRHFRGQQAIAAVTELEAASERLRRAARGNDPERLFDWLVGAGRQQQTFTEVRDRALSLRGFGPWIAFKVADMVDRLTPIHVDFSDCAFGVYKDPRQGAALALHGDFNAPITDVELADVFGDWTWRLRKYKAPPTGDRKVGVQEVETIFCKYKSHVKGHYEPGKDTLENYHGLDGWGDLAAQLRETFYTMAVRHWGLK